MKTTFELVVRAFPVKIMDERTGEIIDDTIVFDKTRLQAANIVGQSSKELIERAYRSAGYKVVSIGKADRLTIDIRLDNIYKELTQRPQPETPFNQMWNTAGDGQL